MESPRILPESVQIECHGQRFIPIPKEAVVAMTHFDAREYTFIGRNIRHGEDIYRVITCAETDIATLIPNARLVFDVKIAAESAQQQPHSLVFQYENDDHIEPCAVMEFDAIEPGTIFSLRHRFTLPSMRGKGLGTRLYAQAEAFFQELAYQTQKELTLQINTGQEGVMRWAEALGFRARQQDEDVYNEIWNNPEHFFKADYFDSYDAWEKSGYLFRKGETHIKPANAVRIIFEKVLPAK